MLMNGTNGNEPGYPEKALVPYPVILAATKGDPDAMKIVLQHFSGYIARLSMRKLPSASGRALPYCSCWGSFTWWQRNLIQPPNNF